MKYKLKLFKCLSVLDKLDGKQKVAGKLPSHRCIYFSTNTISLGMALPHELKSSDYSSWKKKNIHVVVQQKLTAW